MEEPMDEALAAADAADTARRVAGGDREAYACLVSAYQDRVRAQIAGYCRSAEEVEELCHLAFVEAYRKIEAFDPARGSFLGWILTIARSLLLEELRRRRSEGRRAARYLERAAATETPDLEAERAALEHCLRQLDAEEAELVESRYRRGRTSEQLAAALGKTAGAVRMALQRIRERLRACIQRRMAETEV
jgi:RNA polymerase sigma-70 factor (ECF subfamily)